MFNNEQVGIKIKINILTDHSLTSSSHWVSEQSTDRNWSHNFSEIGTFKLAFIQVTIKVYNKYIKVINVLIHRYLAQACSCV